MNVLAIILGGFMVIAVLADLVNTLVTTSTSQWRWWPTRILYRRSWAIASALGTQIKDETRRERLYSLFAPLSVLGMLVGWVTVQVVGFAFISWGIGGVSGIDGLIDSIYFSGVVFFTVGFGEVVPIDQVPRFMALAEAFAGVLTTALVVGYLPALYSAYSEREQKLLTLDDGSEDRITPTNLVMSRAPDGDPRELDDFFTEWEAWIAQVLETHTSHPMLVLFRSQTRRAELDHRTGAHHRCRPSCRTDGGWARPLRVLGPPTFGAPAPGPDRRSRPVGVPRTDR